MREKEGRNEFVGPPTDALKEKFSAQKIPLQTDYADLIDVAECGRKSAGQSPAQPGGTGAGLQLDEEGRLAVSTTPDAGLSVETTGVGLKLEANKGLIVGTNGLAIRPGNGIRVDAAGVGVTANTGRAMLVDGAGVGVNYGSTLTVSSDKLEVSDVAFRRKVMSTTVNLSSRTWKQIMFIPNSARNAYAQVYITSFNGQKFVLTVCCDGGVYYYGGTYSMSATNVYASSNYGIASVRIGYDYYANTCVDVEITHLGEVVPLQMNYSLSDVYLVQLHPFVDLIYSGGTGSRARGTLSVIQNGAISGR